MQTEQIDQFQFVEQMKTAASITEAAVLLYADACSILDGDLVALCNAVCSMECKELYGTILFDHLAADGAGLTGGQVTVVTIGQVDAHFGCSLHLEAVHCLTGLRNIDLIVLVAHVNLSFLGSVLEPLLSWKDQRFPKKAFFFPCTYLCQKRKMYVCIFSVKKTKNGNAQKIHS